MSVSVVIPTRGPTPYLAEAVASVAEADEVIVVEDGSTEVEEDSLGGARLIRLPSWVGRSRARNHGVEQASGELVAFLDADDVSLPGRVQRQRAALEASPEAALAFGRVEMVDAALRPVERWNAIIRPRFDRLVAGPATFERILATQCPIYTSGTIVRRSAFLDAGGYDARFDAYEDLDLYLRLSLRGGLVATPGEAVTQYRRHGQNTPSDRLFEASLDLVAKHLPDTAGRARRLLLDRRVDALWGVGRFAEARAAALAALRDEPLLLGRSRFVKRLGGSLLPGALLRARRR